MGYYFFGYGWPFSGFSEIGLASFDVVYVLGNYVELVQMHHRYAFKGMCIPVWFGELYCYISLSLATSFQDDARNARRVADRGVIDGSYDCIPILALPSLDGFVSNGVFVALSKKNYVL